MNLRQRFGKHPPCELHSRICLEQVFLLLIYLILSRITLLWVLYFLHVADRTEIWLAQTLTTRRHYPLSYQRFTQAAFVAMVLHRKIPLRPQLIATTNIFYVPHSSVSWYGCSAGMGLLHMPAYLDTKVEGIASTQDVLLLWWELECNKAGRHVNAP